MKHEHTGDCLIACDVPTEGEVRIELEESITMLRAGMQDPPSWMTCEQAIADLERQLCNNRCACGNVADPHRGTCDACMLDRLY